jgi:hypothetical protein
MPAAVHKLYSNEPHLSVREETQLPKLPTVVEYSKVSIETIATLQETRYHARKPL